MKKTIILAISIISSTISNAQTILGASLNLGNTKVVGSDATYRSNVGYAFDINANLHLNASKRFNPKIELGFGQRSYIETFTAQYYTSNPSAFVSEDISTTNTLNKSSINLGTRINILNNIHKLFIDVLMGNNFVVSNKSVRTANNLTGPSITYNQNVSSPYYASFPISIGYCYNNIFSVAIFTNPSITVFDNVFYAKRLNTYGLSLAYYLPILGNKKATTSN